jgi:hypothetical protein
MLVKIIEWNFDLPGDSLKKMRAMFQNELRMANNITSLFSVKSFSE